jgi:hypothetical protein
MYKLYSIGARTEPCGTPAATFLVEESSPSTETLNFLLLKKEYREKRTEEIGSEGRHKRLG